MSPIVLGPPGEGIDLGPGLAESLEFVAPLGVEADFEYRGLRLGDTRQEDAYIITSIDGLDDAEIRDSREVNPSRHGETAFEAFYGGRTVVLNGIIRARSLKRMREMAQALKKAFGSLQPEPLYIRAAQAQYDHFVVCKKNAPVKITEEQKDYRWRRPFSVTVRAADPRVLSVAQRELVIYPNRVPNGTFETDTSGWAQVSTGFADGALTRVTTWAKHGVASARIFGTKDNTATMRNFDLRTPVGASGIAVSGNLRYTVQADVNVINAPDTGTRLRLLFYDSGGTAISDANGGQWVSGWKVGAGETRLEVTAVAPTNAAFASVQIQGRTSLALDVIDINVDNVWLVRRIDAGIRKNIVKNSSFEQNATDWPAQGAGTTVSRVLTQYKYGIASLEVVTALVTQSGVRSASFTVLPSTTYIASIDVKAPSGARVEVGLQELTAAAGNVGTNVVQHVGTGNWQRLYVPRAFGPTGEQARLHVRTPTGDNQSITFWVDGAMIEDSIVENPFFSGDFLGAGWRGAEAGAAESWMVVPTSEWHEAGKINAINEGNFESEPVLRMTGELWAPLHVTNETRGETFKLTPISIVASTWREHNPSRNTLIDQFGANQFDEYDLSSDELLLGPDDNIIAVPVNMVAASDNANVRFLARHAWL